MKEPDDTLTIDLFQHGERARAREREREAGRSLPPPRGASHAGRLVLGLSALLILSGGVGFGVWRHYQADAAVMETDEETRDFTPTVQTGAVRASALTMSVFWPGSTLAFDVADIYARASGYIIKRNVDIGAWVKKGDVLVEISAP